MIQRNVRTSFSLKYILNFERSPRSGKVPLKNYKMYYPGMGSVGISLAPTHLILTQIVPLGPCYLVPVQLQHHAFPKRAEL